MTKTLFQHALCSFIFFAILLLIHPEISAQSQGTPTDKQLQAIEKLMAPIRKKVTDILEADKTGQYKTYKADLEIVATEKDPVRQQALITKLERDHLAYIRASYKKAVINHEEQRREVAKILGHSNFTFGEFLDIQIDFTAPAAALPLRFNTELTCPMEATDFSSASQVASDCIAQGGNCSASVQSLAEIAGGCRSKASVGDKFEIPEGTFTSITVAVQSDISYKGFAFAVAGYGQVNAKFGVRFQAPGIDKVVYAKEVFALAPVIWLSRIKGESDNFVAQSTFSGSFSSSTVVTAQAYVESFALSVPVFSLSNIDAYIGNIDFIRISGSN